MKHSIGRFPRLEMILQALLDEAAAAMAISLAGIFFENHSPEPRLVSWRILADRIGKSDEDLQDDLRNASN